jgi:glycosyltransferase involved in cell wall biosynthesis
MRVLVITNMYPPHHYGGYELNCQEFVTALRARGDDVLVLTSDHRVAGVEDGDEPGVRRVLRLYWNGTDVVDPGFAESLAIERANQRALAAAVHDIRPDVVSAWHMGALSMGLLTTCHRRGVPVVHVVNDDWLVYGPEVDRWTRTWRRAGRTAARVGERGFGVPCGELALGEQGTFVLISEAVRAGAEASGVRFRDATVGGCGVNTEHFPIGEHEPRASWSWKLLHVGRLDHRKGIDTAIGALALLPPKARLDIVGAGTDSERAELSAVAEALEVSERVRFRVEDRTRLAARYAGADVLVFPTRWAEPFGLVPLEAMACATPVVATGTGGSGEYLVDGVNCLLVPPDDPVALAAAVRRLALDDGLRLRLVEGGLATAGARTLDRWVALLIERHERARDEMASSPTPTPRASPRP